MSKETGFLAYIRAAREITCGSVSSKCLLQYYASNVDDHGKFFRSTLDISIDTHCSQFFIRKTNKYWLEIGILSITEHPWRSGKANDYHLHLDVLQKVAKSKQEQKDKTRLIEKAKAAERTQRWRQKLKLGDASQSVTTATS